MTSIQQIFKHSNFLNEQHKVLAGLLYLGSLSEKHVDKTLEPFNLPVNNYRILRGLKRVHPKGIGVYKLRDFLIDQKADISRLVERMAQRGLVERRSDPENRSITQVIISPKGLEIIEQIEQNDQKFVEPLMVLSTQEATELNRLLDKVLNSFEEDKF